MPGARTRSLEDLLADDRALDVVRAEVERHLRERQPHHDPVGLDVRHVVEQEPRDGDHLQVVGAGRVAPAPLLEHGVLGMERERHEGEEAARLVLERAQPQQVVDALLVRLHVAVEHRAVRRDAERVGVAMDVEPLVGVLLARRDEPPYAVGEDLGAAARQRAEPRRLQLAQHRLVRDARELRHVVDLAGREELQVDVRHRVVELRDDLDVVAEVDVRALAPDHVDLGEPGQLALAQRVLDELLPRVRVGARLLLRHGERAELALHAADVRLVEIEVLDEEDAVVSATLPPREVGELADRQQVVGLEEREAVLGVEALARLDLLADRAQRGDVLDGGHELAVSVDDEMGQRFELLAVHVAVEARARAVSVVERDRPGALERARGGDADEGAVERAAGEGVVHDPVLTGGEEQRQRRRPLAEVDAGDLARLGRLARAVEDVVRDLERRAERRAELAEPGLRGRRSRAGTRPRRACRS